MVPNRELDRVQRRRFDCKSLLTPKPILDVTNCQHRDDNGGPAKGTSANAPAPTHKLGPKANQGAINAGLRALDRTGTPCRKWQKKGFLLKTFTGVCWELPSWHAPPKNLDSSGDSYKGSQATSNSQSKDTNSSSNVGSENSPAPVTSMLKEGIASSPIPGLSVSA